MAGRCWAMRAWMAGMKDGGVIILDQAAR